MIAVIRAWPTLLRVAVAEMVAYRAEMIIWVLTATLPLVMLALWNAAAAEGPLAGFGRTEFARYFVVTLVVRQMTGAWLLWELNHQIRSGGLSTALLRPMNPLWWNLAETFSALPWRGLVLAPILGLLAALRPDVLFWPGVSTILLGTLSVALAFAVAWLVQCLFGILAFWLDDTTAIFQVYFFIWGFLSGYIVPLPLLPTGLGESARMLPFHASLGAPVEMLMGICPDPLATLGAQAGWVLVLGGVSSLLWKRGLIRYGACGA